MKKLTFADHGKLALCVFGLGALMVVAWTRPLSPSEIILAMTLCVLHGFLIRSIVVNK